MSEEIIEYKDDALDRAVEIEWCKYMFYNHLVRVMGKEKWRNVLCLIRRYKYKYPPSCW